jgi:hypothetical protein
LRVWQKNISKVKHKTGRANIDACVAGQVNDIDFQQQKEQSSKSFESTGRSNDSDHGVATGFDNEKDDTESFSDGEDRHDKSFINNG